MNSQVTTASVNTQDVAAVARKLGPIVADVTSFRKDLVTRQNVATLFALTTRAAIDALGLTKGDPVSVWKNWDWEKQLQYLLDIGTPEEAIDRERKILASGPHRMFVAECMEIVHELDKCKTLKEFAAFALDGETNPQKQWFRRVKYWSENAVTVYDATAQEEIHYLPAEDSPITGAVWPLVAESWRILREKRDLLRAERRERLEQLLSERRERATELAQQTTPGLTLTDIVNGKEGTVLVELDEGRAALLTFFEVYVGYANVEIPGTNYSRLVWRPILVDLPSFEPNRGYWPEDSFGFQRALREQLQREQGKLQVEQVRQDLEKRLAVLRTPDLLPEELSQQSATRVLLGQEGSALAYHKQFKQFADSDSSGFFGITLSRKEGKLVLAQVESDFPFPQDLVGKELPLQVQDRGAENAPFIGMDLANTSEEHRNALDMIRRLLVLRTRYENPRR